MFTVISAIAIVGGAIPLIKKSTDQDNKKPAPKSDVDPATAALLAAKSLSLALPEPIQAHGLSKITTPPSILVPAHTPSPSMQDMQVLANLIAAARKHALNRWGSQSLFVKEDDGLDMGVWIGSVDVGNIMEGDETWRRRLAGGVVDSLMDGKMGTEAVNLVTIISLPGSVSSDTTFEKALAAFDAHVAFSMPPKAERQAFFLAGRNKQTQNWVAIGGATGGAKPPDKAAEKIAAVDESSVKVDKKPPEGTDKESDRDRSSEATGSSDMRTTGDEVDRGRVGRRGRGRRRAMRRTGRGEVGKAQPGNEEQRKSADVPKEQQISDTSRSQQSSQQSDLSHESEEGRRRRRRRRKKINTHAEMQSDVDVSFRS